MTEKTFNFLIYGPPGAGKTCLASTACDNPKMGGVLYCDVENGALSIAKRINSGQIVVEECKTVKKLEEIGWKIANKDKGFEDIKTVIIDTVNELQELDLNNLAEEGLKNPSSKRTSLDEPNLRDFGINTTRLKRIFRMFRDLKVNVIFLAHSKELKNDSGKTTGIAPSLTNKVETVLSSFVDFLWYLGQEGTTRKLALKPVGLVRVKTRGSSFADNMPDVVDNPNLGKLYDQILELEYGIKND